MGGAVEGAALGAVFQVFITEVVNASLKISHFRSQLDRLNSTLFGIKLVMADVHSIDTILERPEHETKATAFTESLFKGEELLHKCSKVKWWNVYKRLYYAHKLTKLEASIVRFFQTDAAALHFCESKRMLVKMSKMEETVNKMSEEVSEMSEILKRLEANATINKFMKRTCRKGFQ